MTEREGETMEESENGWKRWADEWTTHTREMGDTSGRRKSFSTLRFHAIKVKFELVNYFNICNFLSFAYDIIAI